MVGGWVLGHWLAPRLLRLALRYTSAREIPFGVLMGILLLFVYFGELSGVHGTIGALLLGVAMSRSAHEFHADVVKGFRSIVYGVFVTIFFAGAWLRLDLSFLQLSGLVVAGLIGATIIITNICPATPSIAVFNDVTHRILSYIHLLGLFTEKWSYICRAC